MGMEVDDAWGYNQSCGIDDAVSDVVFGDILDGDDLVAFHGDIARVQFRGVGVQE